MSDALTVFGIREVREVLEQIAPKYSRNLINATLRGVAVEIKDKAKVKAPRDSGTLKRSMYVYKPRSDPDLPQFQVKFREDGYYWRFVEYGTGGGKGSHIPFLKGLRDAPLYGGARPFLQPAVQEVRADMQNIVRQQFSVKLEKAIERAIRRQARAQQ